MAKTYIGYAQREKETNVNWGAVATGFTDLLNEQRKTKEENEAADALATQELATTLQSSPEGGDRESSDYILDYVNNASNYNLMLKRQLDAGNMSRKQFTTLTQNLTNGTAQIVAITKKYNTYLQNQEKRMKEATEIGGQAAQDVWNAGKIQSFADFRDNAAFIDPTTMKVSQGKLVDKVVDGKTIRVMSDNTADFTQVSTMLGWMGQEIDKFDLTKAIDDTYKTLAPSYQTNMPDGSIKDDVRKMPGFQKAVNGKLKSYLNDPRNVASVLADYAQMAPKGGTDGAPTPWEFTDDVKKANNKNAIYLTPDSSGNYNIDLDSKQGQYLQEQALEYMNSQLELKIPRKTTGTSTPTFNKEAANYANETTEIFDAASNWMNLKNGDQNTFASSKNAIIAESRTNDKMLDITDISQSGDNLIVSYFDKNTKQNVTLPISMSGDNTDFLNQGSFIIGSSVNQLRSRLGENFNKLMAGQRMVGQGNIPVDLNSPGISETDIPYNALQIGVGTGDLAKNISLNDYITNIDEYAEGDGADALSFGLNEIFAKQTNPNKSKNLKGLIIDKVENNVLEVYLPEVMTAPVYLEVDEPSITNAVVRKIYNALNEDGKITPRQLSKMLGKQYSKQEQFIIDRKASNKLDPNVQWNDGMGREQQDSRVKVTEETIISTIEPTEILGYVKGEYPSINSIRRAYLQSEDPAIKALASDYGLMQQYFLEAKKDFDKSNK